MIRTPVVFAGAALGLVGTYRALPRNEMRSDYWSEEELDSIRKDIKAHYISEQGTRCCYCDRHLATQNHKDWDVEHVVSRSSHPWFMFEPRNLAVACHDCNNAKSDKRVLVNNSRVTYPSNSEAFRIVHPHFDDFADHVYCVGFVYFGKTDKGKQTIYACDLLRFAQKFIDWDSSISDERFEKDVERVLKDEPDSRDALERLVRSLQ